eukprot:NODE_7550_length_1569_cov_3.175451.p1 GENE.NODE_7550_length_1569_cov_3.175451~~NODE_7550_length_1569_cov_3.175451.p1  ORF type:complete len:442 (+),score=104.51 NODE_7550_length_1569_cov_3.175451:48-1373(+)
MEARGTMLNQHLLFGIIGKHSTRVFRALCSSAIEEIVAPCRVMLLVRDGITWYDWCPNASRFCQELSMHDRKSGHSAHSNRSRRSEAGSLQPVWAQRRIELASGQAIAEAVLWSNWVHVGELTAVSRCHFLALDPDCVAKVMATDKDIAALGLAHARHFIMQLNSQGNPTDVPQFPMNISEVDFEFLQACNSEDHLAFLSHFKQEAGTEATLMKEALERMIKERATLGETFDNESIFLDSDDLVDLRTLRAHVTHSSNLIVLLTPNYLSRPWCLVEIVTAVESCVNIVPVEVQRPGIKFAYPDENLFCRLARGDGLSPSNLQLFEELDIDLKTMADSVRELFRRIALPFSPHKSHAVRQAELQDILARCSNDLRGSPTKTPSNPSFRSVRPQNHPATNLNADSVSVTTGTATEAVPPWCGNGQDSKPDAGHGGDVSLVLNI